MEVLLGVIVIQVGLIGFLVYQARVERSQLMDRLTVALDKPRPVFDHKRSKQAHEPQEPAWFADIGEEVDTLPKELA